MMDYDWALNDSQTYIEIHPAIVMAVAIVLFILWTVWVFKYVYRDEVKE